MGWVWVYHGRMASLTMPLVTSQWWFIVKHVCSPSYLHRTSGRTAVGSRRSRYRQDPTASDDSRGDIHRCSPHNCQSPSLLQPRRLTYLLTYLHRPITRWQWASLSWQHWVTCRRSLQCKRKPVKLEAKETSPNIDHTGRWIAKNVVFLSLVTLTFDLWPWQSNSSERGTKYIFHVNWRKSAQRFPRYFIHKQKSHRQRQKQNLTQDSK